MAELVRRDLIEAQAKAAAVAQIQKGTTPVNPYGPMTDAGRVWEAQLALELEGSAA